MLVHPFNWKRASMAAAVCYGVRGGGAQLAFHLQPGNYDTDSLIQVPLPTPSRPATMKITAVPVLTESAPSG